MRIVRDMLATAVIISLAAACRVEEREFIETPPAEEEVDVRILEQPQPAPTQPTQPAPQQDTMPAAGY